MSVLQMQQPNDRISESKSKSENKSEFKHELTCWWHAYSSAVHNQMYFYAFGFILNAGADTEKQKKAEKSSNNKSTHSLTRPMCLRGMHVRACNTNLPINVSHSQMAFRQFRYFLSLPGVFLQPMQLNVFA